MSRSSCCHSHPRKPSSASPAAALTVEEASAALVTLINGRPTTPSREEIHTVVARIKAQQGGGPVHERIRTLVAQAVAIQESLNGKSDADVDRINASQLDPVELQLEELQARLPHPPRSLADVVALAQVAAYWSDDCPADHEPFPFNLAGRLIQAVLLFGEVRHG